MKHKKSKDNAKQKPEKQNQGNSSDVREDRDLNVDIENPRTHDIGGVFQNDEKRRSSRQQQREGQEDNDNDNGNLIPEAV